jgi:F0F1-type ATP synthase membrane subunit c/vacuolar-type H+-ATPase subunit K
MRVVVVPAPIVASGHGVPTVCVRHGAAATEHRDITFRSLTPFWVYLLYFVVGPVLVVLIAVLIRRKVRTPAWPFCPRCARVRTIRWTVLATLIAMSAVCFAAAVTTYVVTRDDRPGGIIAVLVLAGLLILAAGLALGEPSTRAGIANGYVAAQGMTVEFRNPDPEFLRQIVAAKDEFQRYVRSGQPVVPVAPPF